jgi:aldose 1-epimerase
VDSIQAANMKISSEPWGKTQAGEPVELFTLATGKITAQIATYGGIIVSLKTPDREGKPADIVLGKDTLAEYEEGHPFFGTITGRYANRISGGSFTLDGKTYQIPKRKGSEHALHGGLIGFDKKVWKATTESSDQAVKLLLTYTSADGEEGFPGELKTVVTYTLQDNDTLRIDYKAETSAPTVINLTNHSYFNLAGHDQGDIQKHELIVHAEHYTETDSNLIPMGKVLPLAGTPLDFSAKQVIGTRIDEDFPALKYGHGYDHNYVLKGPIGSLRPCAWVKHPASGRVMTVMTTCPAVQLYTANHMKNVKGKKGASYPFRAGFCLETQHYPDSPNQPSFPTTTLRPGETYLQTTTFTFSAE